MTTTCDEAAGLFKRFHGDEVAAYNAYMCVYSKRESGRDREHRRLPARLVRANPNWKPEDLRGRRVLVIGENGPGDVILTLGCLQDLCACCEEVTWQCDSRLGPLLRRSFPGVRFISESETPDGPELVVHAWQLIGRFRPSLESFAWTRNGVFCPYLHGKHPKPGKAPKARIGLAWHSDGGKPGKSCDLDRVPGWEAFFNSLGEWAEFVSLQHGETQDALESVQCTIQKVKDRYGIAIYQDPGVDAFNDFCALGSQVAGLDYVVGISTTVIHLAGALGVPGSVLLPDEPLRTGRLDSTSASGIQPCVLCGTSSVGIGTVL